VFVTERNSSAQPATGTGKKKNPLTPMTFSLLRATGFADRLLCEWLEVQGCGCHRNRLHALGTNAAHDRPRQGQQHAQQTDVTWNLHRGNGCEIGVR
jgi:hypothetical protein